MPAQISKVLQGSDVDLTITLTQQGTNTPINIGNLTGLACWIAHEVTNGVIQKFSLNALTGFGTLVSASPAAGVFTVRITAASTANANPGRYYIEVKEQHTSSGVFSYVAPRVVFMEIFESVSTGTTTL